MSEVMNSEGRLGEIKDYPLLEGEYWRGTGRGRKKEYVVILVFLNRC